MGSPPAKRTALTIGSHGQSELRKRELLQTYLNFFYASARLAGFTDDRIFGGAPENKGNMFQLSTGLKLKIEVKFHESY